MSRLMTPLKIGNLLLKNRVIMAPLTRLRAGDGRSPTPLMAEYYRQRAGAGMILSEATAVSPMGVGYPDTPGIWSEQQVEGWRAVTDAVHAEGGCIFLQLWHVGRISDPHYFEGELPVAPSAIAAEGHVRQLRPIRPHPVPRALEIEEISDIVDDFRRAARNAQYAGFDGVEIHAANGYLPNQFMSPASNIRTDEYGGSVEGRTRFTLEILDAVIGVWGAGRVGLHFSPGDYEYSVAHPENAATYQYLMREAGKRRIGFVCAREALDEPDKLGPRLKAAFGGVYIVNESISPEEGEAAITRGDADAVAFGRLFISNPDLPRRIASGTPLNTPNPSTFYPKEGEPLEVGFTDYPTMAETAAADARKQSA